MRKNSKSKTQQTITNLSLSSEHRVKIKNCGVVESIGNYYASKNETIMNDSPSEEEFYVIQIQQ